MEENQTIGEENIPQGGQNESSQQDGAAQPLDMNQYGHLIASGKPRFETETLAVIKQATLMQSGEQKDGQGTRYHPVFLKVLFSVQIDGEDREVTENYGGGRLFLSETKGPNFWVGPGSYLGALIQVVHQHLDFNGKLQELSQLLQGQLAVLQAEKKEVEGNKYEKNAIQRFQQT